MNTSQGHEGTGRRARRHPDPGSFGGVVSEEGKHREHTVGLVANPMSSKDIRRLTGLARVIDVEEKANLVARLLIGIGSVPGIGVTALDDTAGLVRRAVSMAGRSAAPVDYLSIEAEGSEADSRAAAATLSKLGAACLVTVGGDGTVRAAAEGWPEGRIVPLAA